MSVVPEGTAEYSATYKVLVIGDTSVGKTALLNRFNDGSFHSSLVSTVGEYWTTACMYRLYGCIYTYMASCHSESASDVCTGIDHKNKVMSVEGESIKLQIWYAHTHTHVHTHTHT